jgi:squalene-hopene/tetraprenyl-beta-curcumene cyclase
MRLAFSSLVALLLLVLPAPAQQDTKGLADELVRQIRSHQNVDWTYGDSLLDTARVLDLLARSPRRYNELDGPFFRRAAECVALAEPGALPDGWKVLALASAVTPDLRAARTQALARLVADPDSQDNLAALLALHSQTDGAIAWPDRKLDDQADRALLTLLVDDPALVEPAPVSEPQAWARWARAARLRGLTPIRLPDLPAPGAPDGLPRLLDDLELVIAIHGLPVGPEPVFEAPKLPAKVSSALPLNTTLERALDWFEAQQDDGTFGLGLPGWDGPEPGITALCLSAAIRACDQLGRERPDWIEQGLDYLVGLARSDGGIYDYGVKVYTTSVSIEALLDGGRAEDLPVVSDAREFLVIVQADAGEGYSSDEDPHFGGVGYGGDERPDLSNTQMAIEAAARAGEPADSLFYRQALLFLERNQNLGEVASRSWPRADGGMMVAGTDGGATYMPGSSPAGEDAQGEGRFVARSYGSMTYALTKSYLICGLDPSDERVQAAIRWLGTHFTLDTNPGFDDPIRASDGRYYYYMAMARTLRLLQDDLVDASGESIDWRGQLDRYLRAEQRIDGSWINEHSARWLEGAPPLCSAYAVLALIGTKR